MGVSEIYVHDARLRRVIEDVATHSIVMQVDLPILALNEALHPRFLVFEDTHHYQVFEQPFKGPLIILDMRIIGRNGQWQKVRLETNGGHRDLCCASVRVSEHNPIK